MIHGAQKAKVLFAITFGIETRKIVGDNNNKGTDYEMLFSQAYGYFECRAKFPNSKGMLSPFWLQSSNMRKVGNKGRDGDVSRVKEFLRLTVEIDAGDGYGPHGQKIGKYDDSKAADDFAVDYVKVYQNENYEKYIQKDDEFNGDIDLN